MKSEVGIRNVEFESAVLFYDDKLDYAICVFTLCIIIGGTRVAAFLANLRTWRLQIENWPRSKSRLCLEILF